jgi:hypothetical protein
MNFDELRVLDLRSTEDERVEHALEELRKNFYHLWKVLEEARHDPSLIEEWRQAPEHSQGWRKARHLGAGL